MASARGLVTHGDTRDYFFAASKTTILAHLRGSKEFLERVRHHGGLLDGPEAVDEDVHLGLDRDA